MKRIYLLPILILTVVSMLSAKELDTIPSGPYRTGSSCLFVKEGLIPQSPEGGVWLTGGFSQGKETYFADMLAKTSGVFSTTVTLPDDPSLGAAARRKITTVGVFFYPVDIAHTNADYVLLSARVPLPSMLKSGELPVFADPDSKYPLIVFSHGYGSDPLVHVGLFKYLASQGYIVLALFHADGRFDSTLPREVRVIARTMSVSAALDTLFTSTDPVTRAFAQHVDTNRIAGGGISLGGLTFMIKTGADTKDGYSSPDPRFKAIFAHYGYLGSPENGIFDKTGLVSANTPSMFIQGDADPVADFQTIKKVLTLKPGANYLIRMENEKHGVGTKFRSDANTWTLLFLNAYLREDKTALQQLKEGKSVKGTGKDSKDLPRK